MNKKHIPWAVEKMVALYGGRQHDVNHMLKVWGYARAIGLSERLDEPAMFTLELSAIVHDIACPHCRAKYGHCKGAFQEAESEPLLRDFFRDSAVPAAAVERIVTLVGRHHTYTNVDGMDCQILLEADFLVNAGEKGLPRYAVENFSKNVFRTPTGKALLEKLYLS